MFHLLIGIFIGARSNALIPPDLPRSVPFYSGQSAQLLKPSIARDSSSSWPMFAEFYLPTVLQIYFLFLP